MKQYLLCDVNKRCTVCGSSLHLVRKNAAWFYQFKKTSVERPTNLFNCRVCHLDHVIKGDHVDDSGWERLELLITTPTSMKNTGHRGNITSSSTLKAYFDPKIKEDNRQKKQLEQPNKPKSQGQPVQIDLKKSKGIHKTNHEYRNCGNCDFFISNICRTHSLKTFENEVCNRFKHYHKREVFGGSFSPR